jgi:hypothetical protein
LGVFFFLLGIPVGLFLSFLGFEEAQLAAALDLRGFTTLY